MGNFWLTLPDFTFSGLYKLITVHGGRCFEVQDLYDDWMEWAANNPSYLPAMRFIGGWQLATNTRLAKTFFLINGWKLSGNYNGFKGNLLEINGIWPLSERFNDGKLLVRKTT